jgi:hypothetical protein
MRVLVVRRLPVMMMEGVATTVEISGALKNSSKGKERTNMTHMTREETLIIQLLNRARTVAVVGASPRPERHSHTVVSYLHRVGYDVIPVRPDLQQVEGLKAYARLADIPVQIDLAVIFRRPDAVPPFVARRRQKAQRRSGCRQAFGHARPRSRPGRMTCCSSKTVASRKSIGICQKAADIPSDLECT